jgi:hypothetical protein
MVELRCFFARHRIVAMPSDCVDAAGAAVYFPEDFGDNIEGSFLGGIWERALLADQPFVAKVIEFVCDIWNLDDVKNGKKNVGEFSKRLSELKDEFSKSSLLHSRELIPKILSRLLDWAEMKIRLLDVAVSLSPKDLDPPVGRAVPLKEKQGEHFENPMNLFVKRNPFTHSEKILTFLSFVLGLGTFHSPSILFMNKHKEFVQIQLDQGGTLAVDFLARPENATFFSNTPPKYAPVLLQATLFTFLTGGYDGHLNNATMNLDSKGRLVVHLFDGKCAAPPTHPGRLARTISVSSTTSSDEFDPTLFRSASTGSLDDANGSDTGASDSQESPPFQDDALVLPVRSFFMGLSAVHAPLPRPVLEWLRESCTILSLMHSSGFKDPYREPFKLVKKMARLIQNMLQKDGVSAAQILRKLHPTVGTFLDCFIQGANEAYRRQIFVDLNEPVHRCIQVLIERDATDKMLRKIARSLAHNGPEGYNNELRLEILKTLLRLRDRFHHQAKTAGYKRDSKLGEEIRSKVTSLLTESPNTGQQLQGDYEDPEDSDDDGGVSRSDSSCGLRSPLSTGDFGWLQ